MLVRRQWRGCTKTDTLDRPSRRIDLSALQLQFAHLVGSIFLASCEAGVSTYGANDGPPSVAVLESYVAEGDVQPFVDALNEEVVKLGARVIEPKTFRDEIFRNPEEKSGPNRERNNSSMPSGE